jgi:metal-responsive CopG/Arc/MetJ family transcriptional regulator
MNRCLERRNSRKKAVIIRFPRALLEGIKFAARLTHLDRSKFIRAAIREKLDASSASSIERPGVGE